MKKTFKVEDFKNHVNDQLTRNDNFACDRFKAALCSTLEHVLHRTGNYKGFLDVYWIEKGYNEWVEAGKPETEKDKYLHGPTGSKYTRKYY